MLFSITCALQKDNISIISKKNLYYLSCDQRWTGGDLIRYKKWQSSKNPTTSKFLGKTYVVIVKAQKGKSICKQKKAHIMNQWSTNNKDFKV